MNFAKLREWLNLPPGPWPPADREVLGFADTDPIDATTVEIRALERMDMLRPRQLTEPDLVTEGMNRLAQAMIALSSNGPTKFVDPPKKPKKPVREKTPVEIRKPLEVNLDLGGTKPSRTNSATISLPATPAVLEAEVLSLAPDANDVIPESVAVQSDDTVAPILLEPIVIPEPPPGTVMPPAPRRKGYRNLARLRHRHDAWMKFRPILGDPSEPLLTPARIATYLSAISNLRSELAKPIQEEFPEHGGETVLTVVCHPVPLMLLRDLQPSQRVAVARDWAVGEADLRAKIARLRKSLRREKPKRSLSKGLRAVKRAMSQNPEWILVMVVVAMVTVGIFRR